jgi:hypothetical protein
MSHEMEEVITLVKHMHDNYSGLAAVCLSDISLDA